MAVEVFEGNTADPKTVSSQVAKVREQFGLQTLVLVGDRGMITSARIRQDLRTVMMWKDLLNDHEVDSIVRYVMYLQRPTDRGGQNLGHLGPIPEGFVAWMIGLLSLLLVIRWIGATR